MVIRWFNKLWFQQAMIKQRGKPKALPPTLAPEASRLDGKLGLSVERTSILPSLLFFSQLAAMKDDSTVTSYYSYLKEQVDKLLPMKISRLFTRNREAVSELAQYTRIVIIGVHGWFPTWILQKVLGDPTGTSAKFASAMENVILQEEAVESGRITPHIYRIELKGDGMISERASLHYDQLTESDIEQIKQASLVLVLAHSQGSPVAAQLVQRLLQQGVLDGQRQRIGLLSMAGIWHGPVSQIQSQFGLALRYLEREAARELFELGKSDSTVSINTAAALQFCLERGVRTFMCAGWLDPVVPLYSALACAFDHPNLAKGIFIECTTGPKKRGTDHSLASGTFLHSFVNFLMQLTNYTCQQYVYDGERMAALVRLSRMLQIVASEYFMGSLYDQSEGHSVLYTDPNVYNGFLNWTLCKRRDENLSLFKCHPDMVLPSLSNNSYYLPWVYRALLSHPKVAQNRLWNDLLTSLPSLHGEWMPAKKQWKELRRRLEPITSRL